MQNSVYDLWNKGACNPEFCTSGCHSETAKNDDHPALLRLVFATLWNFHTSIRSSVDLVTFPSSLTDMPEHGDQRNEGLSLNNSPMLWDIDKKVSNDFVCVIATRL